MLKLMLLVLVLMLLLHHLKVFLILIRIIAAILGGRCCSRRSHQLLGDSGAQSGLLSINLVAIAQHFVLVLLLLLQSAAVAQSRIGGTAAATAAAVVVHAKTATGRDERAARRTDTRVGRVASARLHVEHIAAAGRPMGGRRWRIEAAVASRYIDIGEHCAWIGWGFV